MRVVRVDGHQAWLEPVGDCGPCAGNQGCGARQRALSVPNSLRAVAGETVIIGVDDRAVTRAAWYVYGLPLAALLAGGLLMQWFAVRLGIAHADLLAIAGAASAFAAAFGVARRRLGGAFGAAPAPVMLRRQPAMADFAKY